jgi:hypothetical protein
LICGKDGLPKRVIRYISGGRETLRDLKEGGRLSGGAQHMPYYNNRALSLDSEGGGDDNYVDFIYVLATLSVYQII